jgi:DNA-binding NtrC family response regulator
MIMTARVPVTAEGLHRTRSTILLVDAKVSVLALVKAMLEGQGHRVLVANCAETAMRLVRSQPRLRIDYLMTDVADSQAPDLAAQVLSARPEVEMLFMSAVRDPDAIRFKMIDDASAAHHTGCDPAPAAGNSYPLMN